MVLERRRANRAKKNVTIQYQKINEKGHWDMTESKDFSEFGITITSAEAFEVGAVLRLRIKLPLSPFKLHEFEGRVVACEKNVTNSYQDCNSPAHLLRIEIIKLDEETRDLIRQSVVWYSDKPGSK